MTEDTLDAKELLLKLRIDFHEENGLIIAQGSIDLSNLGLDRLPDLSKVHVKGDFICSHNKLKNLSGAPAVIEGHLFCNNNMLETLTGAPARVGGCLICKNNNLKDLTGCPPVIGLGLDCNKNPLESLKGIAKSIGAFISIGGTEIKSIDDFPLYLGHSGLPPADRGIFLNPAQSGFFRTFIDAHRDVSKPLSIKMDGANYFIDVSDFEDALATRRDKLIVKTVLPLSPIKFCLKK